MNVGTILLILVIFVILCIMLVLLYKCSIMSGNLKKLKNTNQKVSSLNILQDFMEIIGNGSIDTDEKMKSINQKLIEKYEIKYSTIVLFNGMKYNVEASNVSDKHWKEFENLHNQDIFLESINNATPKYITIDQGEKLPYMKMEFDRAKSAIFYPIYVDNIYMGYWLIEGGKPHEFDNIDTTILNVVKDNLTSAIKVVNRQRTMENMYRQDSCTGIYTYEYLYGKARKTIDKYPTSIVSLIKITNLRQIEDKTSRKTAEITEKSITEYIKGCLSPEYIFVKYNENTFVIVFSGSDVEGVSKFLENIKDTIAQLRIKIVGSLRAEINGQTIAPKTNMVLMTYYKETALEEVINNLVKYLEEADAGESDITCL